MRVDRLVWMAVVVALGACVNGLPYGLEPLPADEDDTYEPVVTAPDCRPNNDGVIERDEMPFVVGAVARIRVGEGPLAVNVDGFEDESGEITWDFSTPEPTSQPLGRLELQTMGGQWYAADFPGAQYAGPLNPGGSLRGAVRVDDTGVSLLGSASEEQNPPEGRSHLVYDAPVTLYPFPLQEGARAVSNVRANNAMLLGLPTALQDTYEVAVTARGKVILPDLILHNTLRVTLRLKRTLVVGDVQQVTHVFVHECLGEVARIVSPTARLAETLPDNFSTAQEMWRLSL